MTLRISKPVGPWEDRNVVSNGGNRRGDVRTVQSLLQRASQQLHNTAYDPGTPDGLIARAPRRSSTLVALEAFQRRFLSNPDRRVDVGGRTWSELQAFESESGAGAAPAALPDAERKRGVIFAPRHNSPGKHDATGAFHPGARTFQRVHGASEPIFFDHNNKRGARETIFNGIREGQGPLQVVAYFGHGLTSSLSSGGIYARHVGEFASVIRDNSTADCKILLYACSAGALGGFASQLAEQINGRQGSGQNSRVVYGHTCSGHSFYNPFVTRFPPGEMLIERGSSLWNAWRRALRAGDLWARFPFLSDDVLREYLENF